MKKIFKTIVDGVKFWLLRRQLDELDHGIMFGALTYSEYCNQRNEIYIKLAKLGK